MIRGSRDNQNPQSFRSAWKIRLESLKHEYGELQKLCLYVVIQCVENKKGTFSERPNIMQMSLGA